MGKNRAISSNFGSLLRYYRENSNLSLKNIEDKTGISAGYVCRLENGERKAPSIPIIQLLADALDVDITELLDVSVYKGNEDVKSVSELLIINDFLINGNIIEKKPKELLISIINKIVDAPWGKNTKMRDSFEIVELIEDFKNELAG